MSTGCYRTKPIAVNPVPVAIAGNMAVCVGGHSIVTDATTTGSAWTSSNTSVATISTSGGLITGISAGTATITYTLTTGCFTTAVTTISATPDAGTISGPASVSISASTGSSIIYTDGIGGGAWTTSDGSIATIGGTSGQITGVSAGAVTITYTVNNGCGSTFTTLPVTITSPRAGGNVTEQGQNTAAELQLFPNPTNGTFTVNTSAAGTFAIFSVDGKAVKAYELTEGVNVLSMPNGLASGIYMCHYKGNDGSTAVIRLVYEQ
jgi:uncharacterized protein YjdB